MIENDIGLSKSDSFTMFTIMIHNICIKSYSLMFTPTNLLLATLKFLSSFDSCGMYLFYFF